MNTAKVGQIQNLEEPAMEKKSLVSAVKITKKANLAAAPAKKEDPSTRKAARMIRGG